MGVIRGPVGVTKSPLFPTYLCGHLRIGGELNHPIPNELRYAEWAVSFVRNTRIPVGRVALSDVVRGMCVPQFLLSLSCGRFYLLDMLEIHR